MSRRLQCCMDGMALDSVDESIRLLDMIELPAAVHRTVLRRSGGGGSVPAAEERTSLSVRLSVGLYERSLMRRAMAMEKLAAWCAGRTLTCTPRPGRMLRVRCSALPALGSQLDWTAPIELTLTAWEVPWWQDLRPVSVTLDSQERPTADWYVPGTAAQTPVSCRVTNLSDRTMTEMTLTCGGTRITLDGLLLQPEETAAVTVDADGVLSIRGSEGSLAKWRTAESDDLLLAACGCRNPIRVQADARVTAVWEARGRYR